MSAFDNVLVIEDNPGDARMFTVFLNEGLGAHCAVRQAGTLADGLAALRQVAADVVLLDLGLPDSQGLAGYIEVSRHAPSTPVVVLTGRSDDNDALHALSLGADDYLAKHSLDGPSLVRAVRHAVQRRRLTDQLRDSEARFRAIVETAEEGILQVGRDGSILFMNARAHQILGLPTGEPERMPDLRGCVAESAEPAVGDLLATPPGQRVSRELALTEDAAPRRWVLAAAGGQSVQDNVDPGIVLLLTDITERRRTEDELARVRSNLELLVTHRTTMLEAANAELRAIGRAMAHDLRTPLSGIIGLTTLVKLEAQHGLSTMAWQRLLLVEQSAHEMNELIGRLLATVALGDHEPHRVELDLTAMAETLAIRLQAAEPDRVVRWVIQPGLRASGDRALVANVLQNLLGNAWKYTSRVSDAAIEFGSEIDAGSNPIFYVRDNGVGFDMTLAGRLFEPFERLPSARDYDGTGLGLASVKRNLSWHGGIVWAKSMPQLGSVFFFTLAPPAAVG